MAQKRRIHSDLVGTLITRKGMPTKNGPIIFSFLQAASSQGHDVRTASSASTMYDRDVTRAFTDAAEFLLPTQDKFRLMGIMHNNTDEMPHDILIDDDPMVGPQDKSFNQFANKHIDPNSVTLVEDLKQLAIEDLGFEWNGPD